MKPPQLAKRIQLHSSKRRGKERSVGSRRDCFVALWGESRMHDNLGYPGGCMRQQVLEDRTSHCAAIEYSMKVIGGREIGWPVVMATQHPQQQLLRPVLESAPATPWKSPAADGSSTFQWSADPHPTVHPREFHDDLEDPRQHMHITMPVDVIEFHPQTHELFDLCIQFDFNLPHKCRRSSAERPQQGSKTVTKPPGTVDQIRQVGCRGHAGSRSQAEVYANA